MEKVRRWVPWGWVVWLLNRLDDIILDPLYDLCGVEVKWFDRLYWWAVEQRYRAKIDMWMKGFYIPSGTVLPDFTY